MGSVGVVDSPQTSSKKLTSQLNPIIQGIFVLSEKLAKSFINIQTSQTIVVRMKRSCVLWISHHLWHWVSHAYRKWWFSSRRSIDLVHSQGIFGSHQQECGFVSGWWWWYVSYPGLLKCAACTGRTITPLVRYVRLVLTYPSPSYTPSPSNLHLTPHPNRPCNNYVTDGMIPWSVSKSLNLPVLTNQ